MNDSLPIVFGILTTLILGAYSVGWFLHNRLADRYEKDLAAAKAVADKALADIHGRMTREIQRVEQNFHEYKLHVATSFTSLQHLQESERRTSEALNAINGKLDRLMEGRISK